MGTIMTRVKAQIDWRNYLMHACVLKKTEFAITFDLHVKADAVLLFAH